MRNDLAPYSKKGFDLALPSRPTGSDISLESACLSGGTPKVGL